MDVDRNLHKTVVINIVALTKDLITSENTPNIYRFLKFGAAAIPVGATVAGTAAGCARAVLVEPAFPAVTCVAQTTYLTGTTPAKHGIPANGFYDRAYHEVRNWHQSAALVTAPRIFSAIKERDPRATVFSNCWWFPMYDAAIDFVVTPRPQYLADGGKRPDIYTKPAPLRDRLQQQLGTFPLHRFWGPTTSIASSRWIADASLLVDREHNPTFSLIYLPHLDYVLQKNGPDDTVQLPTHLREVDAVAGDLIAYYSRARAGGGGGAAHIILLSEYGINGVDRPVYINRHLRAHGYLAVRRECGGDCLDTGASAAWALADHSVAHVYVRDAADVDAVRALLLVLPGVERVLRPGAELDAYVGERGSQHHEGRGCELIVIADARSWFAYYWWENDSDAPDYASTVAIHRKPGYDPAEMLFRFEPAWLGLLYLFCRIFLVYVLRLRLTVNATPLHCTAIRGSHGRMPTEDRFFPMIASGSADAAWPQRLRDQRRIVAEDVYDVIWSHLTTPPSC